MCIRDRVGAVLHELARRAVVGVVVAGAVCEDHVRLKAADRSHQCLPCLKGRRQAAVVKGQDLIGDAEQGGAGLRLVGAHGGELFAAQRLVPGVSRRHRDEAHGAAGPDEPGRDGIRGDVAVVGVRADHHGAQRGSVCHQGHLPSKVRNLSSCIVAQRGPQNKCGKACAE